MGYNFYTGESLPCTCTLSHKDKAATEPLRTPEDRSFFPGEKKELLQVPWDSKP